MNKLVWKLLRQHISIGQLSGFFLANIFGMLIVLLSVQFYKDVLPVFTQGDSFMKKDYIIATKKISTLGSITGQSNTFSKDEIKELEAQPFTRSVGAFTPTLFKVSAGLGMQQAGIRISTDMFFESVPDAFVDVSLDKWHFDESTQTIPIIIPRNYLNLYNFGFAQSRNLPKLSEGVMGLIQMDINMRGNGRVEQYKGNIVGFSNRLNTILVPQSFMEWANQNFAPEREAQPSRLIVEVKNPTDTAITDYFQQKNYETEGDNLDAYSVFCRTLGYGIKRSDRSPARISGSMFNENLPSQVLYLLVRMEKYRWNAERTVAGWRRAEVKDKVFLQHPLIMPFNELLQKYPEEVEKDADVILNLPYVLALGGYELYKLADQ